MSKYRDWLHEQMQGMTGAEQLRFLDELEHRARIKDAIVMVCNALVAIAFLSTMLALW